MAVALGFVLTGAASAQRMMKCLDASGNIVITDQSGIAGLKCPETPGQSKTDTSPRTGPRVWRFSPECQKALDVAHAAQRFDQEAWQKYGRRQDWYGDAMARLPESCKQELEREYQRNK